VDDLATRRTRSRVARPLSVYAIELQAVTLARGPRVVLADVNVAVRTGEFIGVFGPNGAGKTTLLHAVLGLLPPASGELKVLGAPPLHGNRAVGYLPQQRSSVADLRLRGWDFVACALEAGRWGIPLAGQAGRREVDRVIASVEGQAIAARPLSELSGGELQRLLLAQALLGRPKLLLLDEPLLSLDLHFQQAIIALVQRIQRDEGITVLFTAHELNPLLRAMDRVLYLGQGSAALGSVDEVITSEVLTRLYGAPVEVLRAHDRLLVVSGQGVVDADAHRHDV
jgi:zinc/manganese transport system ATP-binding protein